ncbi:hypothetical protein DINM_006513 [Dirofilaria immitis]|nr:hypothetical protein [Dirofilaria immitis]
MLNKKDTIKAERDTQLGVESSRLIDSAAMDFFCLALSYIPGNSHRQSDWLCMPLSQEHLPEKDAEKVENVNVLLLDSDKRINDLTENVPFQQHEQQQQQQQHFIWTGRCQKEFSLKFQNQKVMEAS